MVGSIVIVMSAPVREDAIHNSHENLRAPPPNWSSGSYRKGAFA